MTAGSVGFSRRTVLGGLAAVGLAPWGAGAARADSGLDIRYGWDPDASAPTEATFYVAPDGDDAADGSLTRPVRTVQRGVDLLAGQPEGSLSIRQGIYREAVSLDGLRATSDVGYRIHRHGQERVQITAADVLGGWQPCSADEATALGFAPAGVFVARFDRKRLQHGAAHALNLHEAGLWRSIATDRADMTDPERSGDPATYHTGEFLLDPQDHITAIRDTRLIGRSAAQMREVRVLFYRRPNLVSSTEIADFDPATGTMTLAEHSSKVERSADTPMMLYALQNAGFALQPGQWIVQHNAADEIAVYLHPVDPANLADKIEISLRPACIDFGAAQGVELFGLEVLRAAGQARLDGICIRRSGDTAKPDSGGGKLKILHCRVGENISGGDRGYAALYLRGARDSTLHHNSIGPARNSFGLFLSDCTNADLRFLHIAGVSKSPARFFGLRQTVLAFSLFEDSAYDAHANKFNFYEGSDTVLIYGVRSRRVGGYATYQEASRIHFAFCELDCAPQSQGRALVSQNRKAGSQQGGADGSGDPVAGQTFYYWNNSLLADPGAADLANALVLGPAGSSQSHAFHNNILHGGGFPDIYRGKADASFEHRSHNCYTGLSFWQKPRYGWSFGLGEKTIRIGERPEHEGLDMRPVITRVIAPLFPGFTDWSLDIDGKPVDWAAAPIGCQA